MLPDTFSPNASARQGACKRSRFKSIGESPENQRWLPKQGTMYAIFLDSTFGMTMYVSVRGCKKWKVERCFRFDLQPMGDLICLLLGAAIFVERALAIVQQCNDHTDKCSLERSHC